MFVITNSMPDEWNEAWHFAAQFHEGQKLPGSDLPYIVHLATVALELLAAHLVEPLKNPALAVQCALLHDTLEDTNASEADMLAKFGPVVTAGVRALTKNPALPKGEAMADSLRRIREQPHEIWAVKLADRIANLGAPPSTWSRVQVERYRDEAKMILAELGDAHATLAERLSRKIAQYPPT